MSNSATVTPFAIAGVAGVACLAAGAAVFAGASAAVQFLTEVTPEDQVILDGYNRTRDAEKLSSSRRAEARPIAEIRLHSRETAPLIQAAQSRGFTQVETPNRDRQTILLRDQSGRKLAVINTKEGPVIASNCGKSPLQSLMKDVSVAAARKHLATHFSDVKYKEYPDGTIEMVGQERQAKAGGKAAINARILPDGSAKLDVDGIKGNRCEQIVKDFARELGGQVTEFNKKPAYWALPGEPVQTKKALRL